MAVDTGATTTTVRTAVLVALGYDPSASTERIAMTTASGVEYVPRIKVDRMEALGEHREPFTVIGHTLPPTAMVDGLLGLDFIRGRRIAIDFRDGHITME
jgi:predicted aspartyl protease